MKKIILILLVFGSLSLFAQNDDQLIDFGVTAGLNYNSNGILNITEGLNNASNEISSEKRTGFHAGIYLRAKLGGIYVRPELVYTHTKSGYGPDTFYQSKLEMPVLIGFNIIKPLSFFAGPSFQYAFKNGFSDFDSDEFKMDKDIAVNAQFGLALQLGQSLRLDAKYETGVYDNLASFKNSKPLDGITYVVNTKPNQLILSISFKLN